MFALDLIKRFFENSRLETKPGSRFRDFSGRDSEFWIPNDPVPKIPVDENQIPIPVLKKCRNPCPIPIPIAEKKFNLVPTSRLGFFSKKSRPSLNSSLYSRLFKYNFFTSKLNNYANLMVVFGFPDYF
jgi:hypothetical protein